ncbi:MAG: SCO family protein [Chitinophagaceae bacterium]
MKVPGYFVAERVDSSGSPDFRHYDTIYHRVGEFHLFNQLGHEVSFRSIGQKVVLVDFFSTSCPVICPQLTQNLKIIQDAFAKNDSILQILSFTLDPEQDSIPVLKAYADHYRVNQDSWWFLTGNKSQIDHLAQKEFFVNPGKGQRGPDGFFYSNQWILLDKYRYIRGYYNGLDSNEVKRCANDIALLFLEKDKKIPDRQDSGY